MPKNGNQNRRKVQVERGVLNDRRLSVIHSHGLISAPSLWFVHSTTIKILSEFFNLSRVYSILLDVNIKVSLFLSYPIRIEIFSLTSPFNNLTAISL